MSVLCLAPTALAASRAARRLCDAEDGILFGPSVTTLERLVAPLLAAAGERRVVLEPLAERLLAVGAWRDAGGPYADAAPESGLASALAAALAELRRGEVTAEDARAAASTLEGASAERLRGVARALAAYEAALSRAGALDRAGGLRAAADAAARGAACGDTQDLELLAVAGLSAASPAAWDLLAALVARARRARFHLPFFPERPDVSAPAEPLLRRLEALHELAARREIDVVLSRVESEARAPLPAALLRALGGGPATPAARGGSVVAVPGAGEEGEAGVAARLLASLLDRGFLPDDVAIVAATPRRAGPALARACAEHGVPFASGRGLALADVPAARAVLTALSAATAPSRAALECLAASTYLAPHGADAPLGPLLDRAGAMDSRLAPVEALRRRAAALTAPSAARERSAIGRAAATLDALATALRPLTAAGSPREHARRLSGFLDATGIRRRAARGPHAVVARDLAALARLEEAADQVARALAQAGRGEERLPPDRWAALLDLAAEGVALPAAGEPAAGAVELWGLDEAPALDRRAVVVVGAQDGAFPRAVPPDAVLRDPERIALARHLRRSAVPTTGARRAEALHLAFCGAAAGREVVAFTWAAPGPAGGGGPLSQVVADALAAVGVAALAAPEGDPPLSAARTPREALRAAARDPVAAAALAGTALAERAESARARGAIEAERREALRARRDAVHAGAIGGVPREVLRAALPAEWSPTLLETYARCPFRLLLQLGLRLPDRAGAELDLDGRDEGSLLHAVLERFVSACAVRRAWPPAIPEELAEARAAAESVFARFEAEGRTGDPAVWRARREAVLARVERFVRAEARDHDGLVPTLLEHRFGGTGGAPPLVLRAGAETVALKGRIDRVDASAGRLRVIDYKNAKHGGGHAELLEAEAMGTTSFQVPVYLLVAARELPGRTRLEATYALLRKAATMAPYACEAGDPFLVADEGETTTASPPTRTFARAVVDVVARVRAGEFRIAPRSCDGCPYGAVCRAQGAAEGEEASP